jgi:outer membrane protein assembly factor BamB
MPSARVRRNRTVAVALTVAIVAVVAFTATRSHATKRRSSTKRPAARPASSAPTTIAATEMSAQLPAARSRAAAFADASGLLVAGGLDTQQATSDAVFRVTGSGATTTGRLSVATHDAAAAMIGGRRLVFGGGAQRVGDAVQLVSSQGSASVVAHLPQPRADLTATTIGSTAYLVGGYDGVSASRDVLATNDGVAFHVAAHLAQGVRYPAVTALGSVIYVFGGEWAGAPTGAIQAINTRTGTVSIVGNLPSARTQASAFTVGGAAYVAGGLVNGAPSFDILRFDPRTGGVARVGVLPSPVANAAVATFGDTAYLAGGESGGPLSSVFEVRVVPATAQTAYGLVRPFAGHLLIADRGNNRLIVVDAAKRMLWHYPSATRPAPAGGFYFPDDGFFVDHGHMVLSNEEENHAIVRIAYPSGRLAWSYGHPGSPGSASGYLNQPDDAFLLRDGVTTVADAKNCRVLFISARGTPTSQIGTTGNCVHDPGRSLGYPNGDTPLADGNVLISEINGSWVSEYTPDDKLVWTVQLPLAYPSDPQQIGADLYLVADYTKPGGIVEFTRAGQIVWSYRPTGGTGMLDHPSLAERLPNGLIGVNDDYRHRVALIDPSTGSIVWQYGVVDQPGTGANRVNTPDGFDLLFPDGTTPGHATTG